jgi:hypothetical protein
VNRLPPTHSTRLLTATAKLTRGRWRVACPSCVSVYTAPPKITRMRCQVCGAAFEVVKESERTTLESKLGEELRALEERDDA